MSPTANKVKPPLAIQTLDGGLVMVSAAIERALASTPAWALAHAEARGWQGPRRSSWLAGRAVAAAALAALGNEDVVPMAGSGAPLWPAGVVGSIAHGATQAVALVGAATRWRALGIDVEPDAPLPAAAATIALRSEDQLALQAAFGPAAAAHGRLVFGAKECVHKALHPLRGAWLEFDEVTIDWLHTQADAGRWRARPHSAAAVTAFAGLELAGDWWRAGGALWCRLGLAA